MKIKSIRIKSIEGDVDVLDDLPLAAIWAVAEKVLLPAIEKALTDG